MGKSIFNLADSLACIQDTLLMILGSQNREFWAHFDVVYCTFASL